MKCDACGFFDCGNDCRCRCHPHDKPQSPKLKAWDAASKRTEDAAFEGLASLFG